MTATTDRRTQLRELAEGVASGSVRRSLTDSIVPIEAAGCYDALSVFDALVEAVTEGDEVGTRRLLDVLCQEEAA